MNIFLLTSPGTVCEKGYRGRFGATIEEAWETLSKYPMIRCPKCENLMHNPLSAPFEL